jgi:hypothetical protein
MSPSSTSFSSAGVGIVGLFFDEQAPSDWSPTSFAALLGVASSFWE